jgi:uncharacterized damage-inducible protein DinB
MSTVLIVQFEQFWRIFASIVNDFDEQSWINYGHGLTKPSRLSFHIVQSIKYYMDDRTNIILFDGRILTYDHKLNENDSLISKQDISNMINTVKNTLNQWITNLDLTQANERCTWTGSNLESVVLFVIRHSYFHLGELNALLNEYKKGEASDHFANNIN